MPSGVDDGNLAEQISSITRILVTDVTPLRRKILYKYRLRPKFLSLDQLWDIHTRVLYHNKEGDFLSDMKIYTDIVSGDILISDAFTLKEVNDIAYEVDCAAAEKYNSLDDGVTQRNIVADSFGLQETFMDKQTWLSHIKDYTKKLLSFLEKNNPDRVKPFRERFPSHTKQLLADIEKSKFYTGRSNLGDGMICVLRYREDGKTPYFTFWKDGLKTNEA